MGVKVGKAKTLLRQTKSLKNTSKLKLKKDVKLTKHDPFKMLLDEAIIAQAFWECLKDNDPEGAMEVLSAHLEAVSKSHLAMCAEMPRSTIYHSLKSKNPTIRTVAKLIHCSV
jgi:DNA-binding phage protein